MGTFHGEIELIQNSQNISNNTSNVTANFYVIRDSGSAWSNYTTYAWCVLDGQGQTIDVPSYKFNSDNNRLLLGTITRNISHNTDGTKSITASFSWDAQNSYIGTVTGNASKILTTIPRASSITATNADIESVTTININRASTNFTHTITYSFFDLTGTIVTKTNDTSIGWTIPSSFYAKIPNAKTGTVTLTCTTYNGNTNIGSKTTTFKITANEDECKPTITATLIDSNNSTVTLSGDNTKLIKYLSTAKITPTATAKNSATISKIVINGIEVTGQYLEIQNVESESFNIYVIDSRGYTNLLILSPTIIQYMPITVDATFERVSPTSDEITIKFNGNFYNGDFRTTPSILSNSLTFTWEYREKGDTNWIAGTTQLSFTTDNNTYNGAKQSLGSIFNYTKFWEFKLNVSDYGMNVNYIQIVNQGVPFFDYGVDDNGNNYFNINGYLYVENEIYGGHLYTSFINSTSKSITSGSWQNINTNSEDIQLKRGRYLLIMGAAMSGSADGIATLRPTINGSEINQAVRSTIPISSSLVSSTQVVANVLINNDATVSFNAQVYSSVNCTVQYKYLEIYLLEPFI